MQMGSVLPPTMVRACGSVCRRAKERTSSYFAAPMALKAILLFVKVRPRRRAGAGVIYNLLLAAWRMQWGGLFFSSNTRKWPTAYTRISLTALETNQTHYPRSRQKFGYPSSVFAGCTISGNLIFLNLCFPCQK